MTTEEFKGLIDQAVADAHAKGGVALVESIQKHLSQILPGVPTGEAALQNAVMSIGEQVAANDAFKTWVKNSSGAALGNFGMPVRHWQYSSDPGTSIPPIGKDVTATQFPVPVTTGPFKPFPQRRFRMRDLIPTATIGTPALQYAQITGFSNNAAVQLGEGALKGKSEITTVPQTEQAVTIGHIMAISRQALEDVPQLRSWIDSTMEYFLTLVEDNQVLNGTGVNTLRGILPLVTLNQNRGTDTNLDAIRKAITVVQTAYGANTEVSGHEPTGLVLNPTDAQHLDLAKDANNRYQLQPNGGPPNQLGTTSGRPIWGLNIVVTSAIAAGTALVGAFDIGSTLLIYSGLNVAFSDSHDDYFRRNLVAVRMEYRAMHPVYFPKAYCKVSGIAAAGTTG